MMIRKTMLVFFCILGGGGFSDTARAQFGGIIFSIQNNSSSDREYISHTSSVSVAGPIADPLPSGGFDVSITDGGNFGNGSIKYSNCTVNYSWFSRAGGTFVSVSTGPKCTSSFLTANPAPFATVSLIEIQLTD